MNACDFSNQPVSHQPASASTAERRRKAGARAKFASIDALMAMGVAYNHGYRCRDGLTGAATVNLLRSPNVLSPDPMADVSCPDFFSADLQTGGVDPPASTGLTGTPLQS